MDKVQPLVSVLMACYNHERFVAEALESINNQDYGNIEIILIDDCSKDNSVNIIKQWFENCRFPYTFLENTINQGLSDTCNRLMTLAKGKYISFFATDDIMLPNKTSFQVALLEKYGEEYALAYGDTLKINEKGEILSTSNFQEFMGLDFSPPSGNIFNGIVSNFFFYLQSATLRKQALEDINFKFDSKYISEDWYLQLRLSSLAKFIGSPNPGAKYRIVNTSITQQNWKNSNYGKVLENHFRMIADLKNIKNYKTAINTKLLKSYYSYLSTQNGSYKTAIYMLKTLIQKKPISMFNPFLVYRSCKFAYRKAFIT